MKCTNCGEEIEDGMKFCGSCGTPVPQNKKCPSCGAEIPLKMKFCPECGTPQDGSKPKGAAAIAMGDKNVIAGDVIGKQEITNIAGNATIIKNEDQTKQVRKCHVCGKMVQITHGFECPECGEFTCENCYDSASGLCKTCADKKNDSAKQTYLVAVKKALADNMIDFSERRALDGLAKELGLNAQLAVEIEREAKGEAANGNLSTVEKLEFEKSFKQFYACEGDLYSILESAQKLYESHPTNENILALYLPVLAVSGKTSEALHIINNLGVDILSAYFTAIDICLSENITGTEHILKKAVMHWPESNVLKCYQVYYYIAMYHKTSDFSFLEQAKKANQELKNVAGELELSHQIRVMSLLQKEAGEEIPEFNHDFCEKNGLYYRIVSNTNLTGIYAEDFEKTNENAKLTKIKEKLVGSWDGKKVTLNSGIHNLDIPFDIPITVEGQNGAVIVFEESISITADVVFTGVTVRCDNNGYLNVSGTAQPQFTNCRFEKCRLTVCDSARPRLENCKISDINYGIQITGCASVECKNTSIHNTRTGIELSHIDQEFERQSDFGGVKVLSSWNPIIVKGMYAKPRFSNVEVCKCEFRYSFEIADGADPVLEQCKAYNGEGCGFHISDGAKGTYRGCESYGNEEYGFEIENDADPVMEQCKAYKNDDSGFNIHDGGKGTYRNCEAYGNKSGCGFMVKDNAAPVLEQCKAYDSGSEGDGFSIFDGSKGTYRNCEAYGNTYHGFEVWDNADPVLEQCKAHDNDQVGFYIHDGKGTFRNCEAYGNNVDGFNVTNGCTCTFTNCKSGTSSFSKTTGGTGFRL